MPWQTKLVLVIHDIDWKRKKIRTYLYLEPPMTHMPCQRITPEVESQRDSNIDQRPEEQWLSEQSQVETAKWQERRRSRVVVEEEGKERP